MDGECAVVEGNANKKSFEVTLRFDFSQKDYVCFDFVPRHHNVIRFRRGLAVIKDDFSTVCSWVQFPNKEEWKYDLFLGKFQSHLLVVFPFAKNQLHFDLQPRIQFPYDARLPANSISHSVVNIRSRLVFSVV